MVTKLTFGELFFGVHIIPCAIYMQSPNFCVQSIAHLHVLTNQKMSCWCRGRHIDKSFGVCKTSEDYGSFLLLDANVVKHVFFYTYANNPEKQKVAINNLFDTVLYFVTITFIPITTSELPN